jgi:hypothetical protein
MAQKIDGVVDAVRYAADGQVEWVRVYERRGPTYSDHLLLNREQLIARLKSGKRFQVGRRKELQASTFELGEMVRLVQQNGRDYLSLGKESGARDHLEGVPAI